MNVHGSVALVTGGASGLGEATSRRLLDLGARGVGVLDLNAEKGHPIEQAFPDRCLALPVDIADESAVDAAVAKVHKRFGALHVVVGAAGVAAPGRLLSRSGPIPMADFDRALKVNLYGALHVIRAAAPLMIANPPTPDGERGIIINVSSGAAFEGQIGQIAYSASKAGLAGMTMPLARELGPYGIRVMTVAAGAFDTPMYNTVPPQVKETVARAAPFPHRIGDPMEFALFIEELVRNPMHNARTYRFDAGLILPPSS